MNNDKLSKAAALAYDPLLEEYSTCNEISDDHRFSDNFEKKMSSIIHTESESSGYRRKRISWRFILVAVILFSAGFCLGAAKNTVHDIIVRFAGNDKDELVINSESGDERIGMGAKYMLSELPKGYGLTNSYIDIDFAWSDYSNGTDVLHFAQYKESAYKDVYLDSDTKFEYITDKSGQEYLYVRDPSSASVVWHMDGYVFRLSGNLDKDTLLLLCSKTKMQ